MLVGITALSFLGISPQQTFAAKIGSSMSVQQSKKITGTIADAQGPIIVITAKRKACGIKNEMRFSDGKTKCATKKHPSNETWMLFC